MKLKLLLSLTLFIGLIIGIIFAIPKPSLAASGCCSWHGGESGMCSSGREVCNDGTLSPSCTCYSAPTTYIPPTYIPRPIYIPTPTPWWCKIGDQTYYNKNEAIAKWREIIHQNVDFYYRKWLERSANQNDYNYLESKYPFNNCHWNIDQTAIENEIKSSDEYKLLQDKKASAEKAQEDAIQKANAKNYRNSQNTKNQQEGSSILFWLGWLLISGLVIALIIRSTKKYEKNQKLKCPRCGRTIPKESRVCPSCYGKGSKNNSEE